MCQSILVYCLKILQLYEHFASSYLLAGRYCHLLVPADLMHMLDNCHLSTQGLNCTYQLKHVLVRTQISVTTDVSA